MVIQKNSPVLMSEFLDDLNVLNNQKMTTTGSEFTPNELSGFTQGYSKEASKATIGSTWAKIAQQDRRVKEYLAAHEARKSKKGNLLGSALSIGGSILGSVLAPGVGTGAGGLLGQAFGNMFNKPSGGSMPIPTTAPSASFGTGGPTVPTIGAQAGLYDKSANSPYGIEDIFGMMGRV